MPGEKQSKGSNNERKVTMQGKLQCKGSNNAIRGVSHQCLYPPLYYNPSVVDHWRNWSTLSRKCLGLFYGPYNAREATMQGK